MPNSEYQIAPINKEMVNKVWIGTGWKMNHRLAEAQDYARQLRSFVLLEKPFASVFICPPFTALPSVTEILKNTPVHVAAQNMHWLGKGAQTGEISPEMVKDSGADMVELGHSERRAAFGESDHTVNLKVLSALEHDLMPLVCIGDSAFEKENGTSVETLVKQVKIALHKVPPDKVRQLVIAYEPVWAIGESGVPASPEFADSMQQHVKQTLYELFGKEFGGQIPVLYGGSVNADNALDLIAQPSIDGLFIGRAAWQVESFISIIRKVEAFCKEM